MLLEQATFLVPVVRDSNREKHELNKWASFEVFLYNQCGGYTKDANVKGIWKADDGECIRDISRRYTVAYNPAIRVNPIPAIVDWIKREFDQQAVYVNYSKAEIR